jgi:hypothetical protein
LLYNDQNGNSLREEEEPALPGGIISVSNRAGTVSRTADTADSSDDCNKDPETGLAIATGFVAFKELPEGDYNVSVAAPGGYNATTAMNRAIELKAGDRTYLAFGVQANAKTNAETQIIPEMPGRSPLLGIAGGLILLAGVALGVYAGLLRKTR